LKAHAKNATRPSKIFIAEPNTGGKKICRKKWGKVSG